MKHCACEGDFSGYRKFFIIFLQTFFETMMSAV